MENPIVNGFDEVSLLIVTEDDQDQIVFGIWGLLPTTFAGDWQDYQNIHNSLNISLASLKAGEEGGIAQLKKCVVIVSGFFTSFIKNGEIYVYYVYQEYERPFLLAGVYNVMNDGFITCALVLTKSDEFFQNIHNTGELMPLIVDNDHLDQWLNTPLQEIDDLKNNFNKNKLYAHTISKQFYENDILFDSVLEPKVYDNLPNYFSPDNHHKNSDH